jgi:hypothetical protein
MPRVTRVADSAGAEQAAEIPPPAPPDNVPLDSDGPGAADAVAEPAQTYSSSHTESVEVAPIEIPDFPLLAGNDSAEKPKGSG